jgi:hypothetical protein
MADFRGIEPARWKSLAFVPCYGPRIAPRILRNPFVSYTALIQGVRNFSFRRFRKHFL